jgi:hypothetical protein
MQAEQVQARQIDQTGGLIIMQICY